MATGVNNSAIILNVVLEYFLKSVTNLVRQIVQDSQKLLQKIGRNSDYLHTTSIV